MKTKTLLAGLGLCLLTACSTSEKELFADKELDYCNRQVHRTLEIMREKGDKIDNTRIVQPPLARYLVVRLRIHR